MPSGGLGSPFLPQPAIVISKINTIIFNRAIYFKDYCLLSP